MPEIPVDVNDDAAQIEANSVFQGLDLRPRSTQIVIRDIMANISLNTPDQLAHMTRRYSDALRSAENLVRRRDGHPLLPSDSDAAPLELPDVASRADMARVLGFTVLCRERGQRYDNTLPETFTAEPAWHYRLRSLFVANGTMSFRTVHRLFEELVEILDRIPVTETQLDNIDNSIDVHSGYNGSNGTCTLCQQFPAQAHPMFE